MTPTKKNIEQKSGFKIPENYFDDFRKKLDIELEKETTTKKKFLKPIHYSIAASIVIVIVSTFLFLPSEENTTTIDTTDVFLSDIEYYDIDMDDIYYAYNDELLKEVQAENEVSGDALVDYLTEEIEIDDFILYEE